MSIRHCPRCGSEHHEEPACPHKPENAVEDHEERITELENGVADLTEFIERLEKRMEPRDARQREVFAWTRGVFGSVVCSPHQRALRVLEEAAELAQSAQVSLTQAHVILEYVFEKPAGDPEQEVGGLGLCLLAFAASIGCSADEEERDEFTRVKSYPPEHFQARHNVKADAGLGARVPERWVPDKSDPNVEHLEPTHQHWNGHKAEIQPGAHGDCKSEWCRKMNAGTGVFSPSLTPVVQVVRTSPERAEADRLAAREERELLRDLENVCSGLEDEEVVAIMAQLKALRKGAG